MDKELSEKIMYVSKLIVEYGISEEALLGAMIAHMQEHDTLDDFLKYLPIFVSKIKSEQN